MHVGAVWRSVRAAGVVLAAMVVLAPQAAAADLWTQTGSSIASVNYWQGITFAPASDVKEIPGVGVQGRVRGQPVVVGRPEFVAQSIRNACAVPGTIIRPISRYSVIAVEVAGTYAGLILLRDRMRESAEGVVDELREAGLTNLAVLSGDHRGAVKLVADQLKLDGAYAGLLPADKALQVKALKEQGHVVAFVGDGMNDAPALAVADVGIAMGGSGTDLAMQAAEKLLELGQRRGAVGVQGFDVLGERQARPCRRRLQ